MTRSNLLFSYFARMSSAPLWLAGSLLLGCGGSTVQQPEPELEPVAESVEGRVEAQLPTEPVLASELLPPEVASLSNDASLAQHARRAWVGRRGPIRFTRDGAVRPAEEGGPLSPFVPNVVVDVADEDVRLVHTTRGVRVLLWTRAEDLTRVPVDVVAVRPTRTAAAPANDTPGIWLYPGFRLPSAVVRGDLTEFAYATAPVAFRGFVPNSSLGPVFVTAAPPERGGEWSMLKSNAALRDRPNGRVIVQFSQRGEQEYFEHVVALLGEERSGQQLVAFRGAASGDEHFEVVGWARTRDLMIEPASGFGHGVGVGSGFGSQRSLRVALSAGTAVYDAADGTVIGLVFEDTVVAADAAPEGGFEFDIDSPWGVLSLYATRGTEVPAEAGTSLE